MKRFFAILQQQKMSLFCSAVERRFYFHHKLRTKNEIVLHFCYIDLNNAEKLGFKLKDI